MIDNEISVIIIGNGFDLHHEIPSRYSDFMQSEYFDEEKNIFCKYFSGLEENSIITWLDFESELSTFLICYNKFKKLIKYDESRNVYVVRVVDYCNSPIEQYFYSFLGKLKLDFFIKGGYSGSLAIIKKYEYNWTNLIEGIFISAYREFVNRFYLYIKDINTHYAINLDSKKLNKTLYNEIIYADEIISFNYTKTITNYPFNPSKTKYVHNNIDGDIILGVQSIEELFDSFNSVFYKTTQMLKYNPDKPTSFSLNLKGNNTIKYTIIGHSLGIPDHYVLGDIKDVFSNEHRYTNTKLIIYIYDTKEIEKYASNLRSFLGEDKLVKLFRNNNIIFMNYQGDVIK
ncbi:MAG: AbiH family protein [Candidatus Izemoplasmatales bacterium]